MRISAPRRFSALLSPAGLHLVAYRPARGGLELSRYTYAPVAGLSARDAALALADLVEREGGRGGRVALAVAGFGSYYQIFTLPAAPRDVLLPVITRELRRFFPDLFPTGHAEPIIEYVEIAPAAAGAEAGAQREILAAAVPHALFETIRGTLQQRGIGLEHWTALPWIMQQLQHAFAATGEATAVLLMVPGSPLLGFFHEDRLRLFSELGGASGATASHPGAIVEQVERGALFLRQQFPEVREVRVLLAAEPGHEAAQLQAELHGRPGLQVGELTAHSSAPGALAALGAALDHAGSSELDLIPPAARLPGAAERWARALAIASCAVLFLALGWWAVRAERAAIHAERRVEAVESALRERQPALARVLPLVRERQAHAERVVALERLAGERGRVAELLWPLEGSAEWLQIDDLALGRTPEGWQGTLRATATGRTSAQAARRVDAVYQALRAQVGGGSVALDEMADASPAESGLADNAVAVAFQMTFIVTDSLQAAP